MSASYRGGVEPLRDWQTVSLSDVCTFLSGGTPSKQRADFWTGTIPWVSPKDLKRPRLFDVVDHISEEALAAGSSLAPSGAVFVVIRGMILAKDVPVALAERSMAFNQDVKAVIPGERVDPAFLLYALTASKMAIHQLVGRSAHGTMTLMSDDLAQCSIPLPPMAEQRAIVDLLSVVQRAIEQQERLLALTGELKKALLAKLFTEGLRGEPQRPTDVGLMPSSWELVSLGSIAKIGNGSTPKRDNKTFWDGGTTPWLTSGKIHERFIEHADEFVTSIAIKECHLPRVKPGSLLVAITGQGKTLGSSALVSFETCVSQHLAYAQFHSSRIVPEFVLWYMQTRYQHLRSMSQAGGSTKGALTCGYLKTYPVPLPSVEEQREIAAVFASIEDKTRLHERKRAVLSDLFRTLLHQLMTAQLRVHDLDLSALEATFPA